MTKAQRSHSEEIAAAFVRLRSDLNSEYCRTIMCRACSNWVQAHACLQRRIARWDVNMSSSNIAIIRSRSHNHGQNHVLRLTSRCIMFGNRLDSSFCLQRTGRSWSTGTSSRRNLSSTRIRSGQTLDVAARVYMQDLCITRHMPVVTGDHNDLYKLIVAFIQLNISCK